MKKVFFFLFFFKTATGVYSQAVRSAMVFNGGESRIDVRLKKNNTFTAGFINNIRADIWRSFANRFNDSTDVHWFVNENEVTASFICDSENVMIKYKKDGSLIWTRKVYQSNKLDPLVTAFLDEEIEKRFIIYLVTEIIIDNNTIYEISLQHEKESCFLQILRDHERKELKLIDKAFFKER
jgi:hypothetical protein